MTFVSILCDIVTYAIGYAIDRRSSGLEIKIRINRLEIKIAFRLDDMATLSFLGKILRSLLDFSYKGPAMRILFRSLLLSNPKQA